MTARPRVCLLLGPRRSGKTSILDVVLDDAEPSTTVENQSSKAPAVKSFNAFLGFDIWDVPGERYDIENLENLDISRVGACIFVVDVKALDNDKTGIERKIATAIYSIHQLNENITFDIFCHKIEGMADTYRSDSQQILRNRIVDDLNEYADNDSSIISRDYVPPPISYYFTSIYTPSIWEALSKIVSRLLPLQGPLERLLDMLVTQSAFDKAYLFDMASKLYFASDSTPGDEVTHGLCTEYIDFHWEVDQIYDCNTTDHTKSRSGSTGGANAPNGQVNPVVSSPPPDRKSTKPVRNNANGLVVLTTGVAMAHWEMTHEIALVARLSERTLAQAPAILDSNIKVVRDAVRQLQELEMTR